MNGGPLRNGNVGKRKRTADEADLDDQRDVKRRGIVPAATNDDDLIVLDDTTNGAIVID